MKKATITRLNKMVLNYMSIIGMSKNEQITDSNPIATYFLDSLLKNFEGIPIDISREMFYEIIYESHRIFMNLDSIVHNQNEDIRGSILITLGGSNTEYDDIIDSVVEKFKESLFDILWNYKPLNNDKFTMVRIDVIEDKMARLVKIEDYMGAFDMQKKIEELKMDLSDNMFHDLDSDMNLGLDLDID